MKTDAYLYGVEVEVPDIPQEIVVRRLELLEDNLTELLKVHYSKRDLSRISAVDRAKDFWSKINDKDK